MTCLWLCLLTQNSEFSGHIKSLNAVAVAPRWFEIDPALADSMGVPPDQLLKLAGIATDAQPFSLIDARGRYTLSLGKKVKFEVHPTLFLQTGSGFSSNGERPVHSELIRLSLRPEMGSALQGQLLLDRLQLKVDLGPSSLTIGRQSVGFGVGQIFTPMDLVGPFGPTSVDTEYKRGVDALRYDAYIGASTQVSAVAAWDGPPPSAAQPVSPSAVYTLFARGSLNAVDLHGLFGSVHGDWVVGVGLSGGLGPVALYAEGTVTDSKVDGRFGRAVLGANWRSSGGLSLSGELYHQTIGADSPEQLWTWMNSERVLRGELWQIGHSYAALAGGFEVTPLLNLGGAFIANLGDGGALISPSLNWSAAENISVIMGGFVPFAAGPSPVNVALDLSSGVPSFVNPSAEEIGASIRSEFGQYPLALWLQFRAYY